MKVRLTFFLLVMNSVLWAQDPRSASPPPLPGEAQAQTAAPPAADDDLAQMRLDLDHMESLLNNMSSEVTFLRDQNLQILLNTNGRMWTILIRDLRMQIDREQHRRALPPEHPAASSQSKPPARTSPH